MRCRLNGIFRSVDSSVASDPAYGFRTLSERQFDDDESASAGAAGHRDLGIVAVQNFQPLTHVAHTDACAFGHNAGFCTVADADSIILDFNDQAGIGDAAADGDGAPAYARLQSMLDTVFDERLEEDAGDEDAE